MNKPTRIGDLLEFSSVTLDKLNQLPMNTEYLDDIWGEKGFKFLEMNRMEARVVDELSLCAAKHVGLGFTGIQHRDRGWTRRKVDGKPVDGLMHCIAYDPSIEQTKQNLEAVIKNIKDGWIEIDETNKDFPAIFHKEKDMTEWYCFMKYDQKYSNDICIRVLCNYFGIENVISCHKTFHDLEKQYHYYDRLDMTYCFIKKLDFERVIDIMGFKVTLINK